MMRQWFDSDYRPPGWEGDDKLTDGIDWRRCLPFIVLHLGCLSVLWVGFSWTALGGASSSMPALPWLLGRFPHSTPLSTTINPGTRSVFTLLLFIAYNSCI